jgi:DNA-binding SARP family transcriptional activator/tetratricopeptide (TPR) repeat protein
MREEERPMSIDIRLLGGFEVTVDGVGVPPEAWTRRHASALVKLLALTDGRRLHREQVADALWPGLDIDAAAPRLHKAAHYARKAVGDTAVVLRHDVVALAPDQDVRTDVQELTAAGRAALVSGAASDAEAALAAYGGPLLPDDLYEPWAEETRAAVESLRLQLLRQAGRWQQVLELEPADEEAHLALVREQLGRRDVRGALRQFERLEQAMRRELGTTPSAEAQQMRARVERELARTPEPGSGPGPAPVAGVRLVGRRDVGDTVRGALDAADAGRGSTLLLEGAAGVGKTALIDLAETLALRRGWRTGRGTASAVEGPWPYACVLEALASLCRKHPALLDGLDDVYRHEIERALSGREVRWSGESAHQRLFVAAAELLRLAAAGHGVLLCVDDLHEADEASVRLLHYLSRTTADGQVVIVLAHRPVEDTRLADVLQSLVRPGGGARLDVLPLSGPAVERLLREHHPGLDTESVEHIAEVSRGLPFVALELARHHGTGRTDGLLPRLPRPVVQTFARVALLGTTFTTDELLAVSGVEEEVAYQHLHAAWAAALLEHDEVGHRFRHPLIREALVAEIPDPHLARLRREVAECLAALGAAPQRIAHQFLAAGLPARAVPHVVTAVETAGALGAYRDALTLVEAVRDHAGPEQLAGLLAMRADLLMALGDPAALEAYEEALPHTTGTPHRLVRARLARAACFAGDLETARAVLTGMELEGDLADGPLLTARGHLAYFSGDVETAWDLAGQAREMLQVGQDAWHLVDLVALQGLIAHQRGEWFERFRMEMRRTRGRERLAITLFDAHLCVAEYLLYGPVPYAEVIEETESLRQQASRAGALRGVAFATALIGEAAFLMGDLDRAERELREAVELHRDIDAAAGEAHSLQRLAEVRLCAGDRDEATALLHRALPLARWSVISMHLLQRVYGTMIRAAPDAGAARDTVDAALAALGETDRCPFCDVMLAVPAAIACADAGDVDAARAQLAVAEESGSRWAGTAWQAAVTEARGHLARAEGDIAGARAMLAQAVALFRSSGQQLDADRCRDAMQPEPVG